MSSPGIRQSLISNPGGGCLQGYKDKLTFLTPETTIYDLLKNNFDLNELFSGYLRCMQSIYMAYNICSID